MKIPPGPFTVLLNLLFSVATAQSPDSLLLKNFRPVSIYNIPQTIVPRAAFPVIDIHSHDYAQTQGDIEQWVKTMDQAGIAKTIIQTYTTGKSFDSLVEKYKRNPKRFELWCGFDYTGFGKPGWSALAVAELERCFQKGAKGVGELGDKGEGELYSKPTPGKGIHIDDPQLIPLLEKCGALHMPVSIHIGEDQWMYEKPDSANDGMMNAGQWHVDMNKPGKLNHAQLMTSLENALRQHPKTTFIACHLANCCADLSKLGKLLDDYPNLYADIAARYSEISPVPRYTASFIFKYQDRLLYGTDMGTDGSMYRITFRILETNDEHFYETALFNYHWALYGLGLPKEVLIKIYHVNAGKILNHK
jgi:predicted TIM-barrel fold metal-dependent hydrolase